MLIKVIIDVMRKYLYSMNSCKNFLLEFRLELSIHKNPSLLAVL